MNAPSIFDTFRPLLTTLTLGLAVLALTLAGCSLGGPAATVESFYEALEAGEIDTALDHVSSRLRTMTGDEKLRMGLRQTTRDMADKGGIEEFDILEVEEIGEVATVRIRVEFADGSEEQSAIDLIQEDDVWKIDFEPSDK